MAHWLLGARQLGLAFVPGIELGQAEAVTGQSLAEAVANVAVGCGVAVLTQLLVFAVFRLHASFCENWTIGAIFTVVSIARSYILRRPFEAIRPRRLLRPQLHGPGQ